MIVSQVPQRPQFGRSLVLALVLTAALVGCDVFSGSESDAKEVQVIEDPSSFDLRKIQKDSFAIDTAFIDGDLLRLKVSYEGGCEKHRFTLHSTGPIVETNPPSTETFLSHDAQGDTCRESLQEPLTFDLSPLKERFDLSGALLIGIHTHQGGHPAHRSWYPPEYRP